MSGTSAIAGPNELDPGRVRLDSMLREYNISSDSSDNSGIAAVNQRIAELENESSLLHVGSEDEVLPSNQAPCITAHHGLAG